MEEPGLAYLEWSSGEDRELDDPNGWAEANPALGYGDVTLDTLRYFRANRPTSSFETEHMCRWVISTREPLVEGTAWEACQSESELVPLHPVLAVSMSPDGTRASAAAAWLRTDGTVGVRLLYNVPGSPEIHPDKLGVDLRATAARLGVSKTGFDPLTDAELAKYLKVTKPITGREFAAASAQFALLVNTGQLAWWDADAVTDDLTWTTRKYGADKGSFEAVRALDDRPITASLAAIRAVWLASGPRPASPRVM